jgi:Tfp pilus assembly protein PilN
MASQLLTTLLNSKYKHVIGYTLTAIICGCVMWYASATIKSHYYAGQIANQNAQIMQLQQKISTSDVKIANLNGQLVISAAQIEKSQKVATQAQAKVNAILAKYEPNVDPNNLPDATFPPLPIIPTIFNTLDDCNKEVKTLQVDMGVMIVEIKEDRGLIDDLKVENDLLDQKDTTLTVEVNDLKQVTNDQATVITDQTKQLTIEKAKTSFWKRIAIGAAAVVGALLL